MKKKKTNKKSNKKIMIGIIGGVLIVTSVILYVTFRNDKMVCKSVYNQKKDGYKIENTYRIISKNGIVNKVIKKEIVISKKNEVLKSFEKQSKEQYEYNKKVYGGYTYQISNKKGRLEVDVTIDCNKMDLERFIKDNEAMKQFVNKNNKITLKGAKKLYKSISAKCS